ncbi:hypothetical protein [Streptomyces sp. NPDC057301]|uniref:hypothetical protein n=1 Tax=Streptomyces sp. NPDC057301 TaxID=3346093 RepID=UPI003627D984
MRHCRYRGQPKAHLQHILTAIAMNIRRLSGRSDTEDVSSPRPPTTFQTFLDQSEIPPVEVLANPRQLSRASKISDRVKLPEAAATAPTSSGLGRLGERRVK